MSTSYNIELRVRENAHGAPKPLFELSKRRFEELGLIGEKRVNHFGKVEQGYDLNCNKCCRGFFDIFYGDMGELNGMTREELNKYFSVLTSGEDERMMEVQERMEQITEIINYINPLLSEVPYDHVVNMPIIESMEIVTPCGRQSVHAHTESGRIIYFMRPKKDRFLYDYDALKNFIWSELIRASPLPGDKITLGQKISRVTGRNKRLNVLWNKLLHNPDSIDKVRLW